MVIAALPARSAIVRATRRTRVMARADRPSRAAARSSSACPAPSSGATRRSAVDVSPYVTHRHPRMEKPLGVAIGGGSLLVALVVGLVAVVALTT